MDRHSSSGHMRREYSELEGQLREWKGGCEKNAEQTLQASMSDRHWEVGRKNQGADRKETRSRGNLWVQSEKLNLREGRPLREVTSRQWKCEWEPERPELEKAKQLGLLTKLPIV